MQLSDALYQLVLVLVIAIVVPIVVPLAGALLRVLEARLPGPVQAFVHAEAPHVVASITQQFGNDPNGVKKAKAVEELTTILTDLHVPISSSLIDTAIESAVLAMKQQLPEPPAEVPVVEAPVETPLPVANAFSVASGLNGIVQAVVSIPVGAVPPHLQELDSQAHLDLSSGGK